MECWSQRKREEELVAFCFVFPDRAAPKELFKEKGSDCNVALATRLLSGLALWSVRTDSGMRGARAEKKQEKHTHTHSR